MTGEVDREEIAARLGDLLSGSLPEGGFGAWLARIEIGEVEIPPHDAPLVSHLVDLFEDESIGADRRGELARRFSCCLRSSLASEELARILPLLAVQDRLCEVVRKWRAGVLTRTSFLSFVGGSRLPAPLKGWIAGAAPELLSYFCRSLASCDYEEVVALTRTSTEPG